MERVCGACGKTFESKTARKKTCSDPCRMAYHRGKRPASPEGVSEKAATRYRVANALRRELEELGVADSYEGEVALGLADQLGNGTITGTAYVSLSKELDRRVEVLRLKAERPDDPAAAVKDRVAEKRLQLVHPSPPDTRVDGVPR